MARRTAEQVTADRVAYEERRAVVAAAESLARQKAEELLTAHLSQKQASDLRAKGWFDVTVFSRNGSVKTYQVSRGRAGNVFLVDSSGKRLQRYCIHPIAAVPDADTMLAQKLLLEGDEDLFLRTANMTRLVA